MSEWIKRIERKVNSIKVRYVKKILGELLTVEIREANADGVKTLEIINMHKRLTFGKWRVISERQNQSVTSLIILKSY